MKIKILTYLSIIFVTSGCLSTHVAKDPIEYRQQIVNSKDSYSNHESYQVNRSLKSINSILKNKSKECLNYSFVRDFSYRMGTTTSGSNKSHITYKPTVVSFDNKTELYVQMEITGDVALLYTPPKDGIYILVADLKKISNKKTQADIYYHPYKAAILPTTINKWIRGETQGCPDLKKDVMSGR